MTEIKQGENQFSSRPPIDSSGTSHDKSLQLGYVIPESTIAALSASEVAGMVTDNPDQCIPKKMFHAEFIQGFQKQAQQQVATADLPQQMKTK